MNIICNKIGKKMMLLLLHPNSCYDTSQKDARVSDVSSSVSLSAGTRGPACRYHGPARLYNGIIVPPGAKGVETCSQAERGNIKLLSA